MWSCLLVESVPSKCPLTFSIPDGLYQGVRPVPRVHHNRNPDLSRPGVLNVLG